MAEIDWKTRLVLWNQYEILSQLNPGEERHYRRFQEILSKGFEGEYELQSHLRTGGMTLSAEACELVRDVISMFQVLQQSVQVSGESVGLDVESFLFRGFSSAYERPSLDYALFLRREGRFPEIRVATEDLASGSPMLGRYVSAMGAYNDMDRPVLMDSGELEQVLERLIA